MSNRLVSSIIGRNTALAAFASLALVDGPRVAFGTAAPAG